MAVSAATMALNSAGVLPRGSAPYCSRAARQWAVLTAAADLDGDLVDDVPGHVPAGAISPFQVSTLKSGKLDSATVGTSGSSRRALFA